MKNILTLGPLCKIAKPLFTFKFSCCGYARFYIRMWAGILFVCEQRFLKSRKLSSYWFRLQSIRKYEIKLPSNKNIRIFMQSSLNFRSFQLLPCRSPAKQSKGNLSGKCPIYNISDSTWFNPIFHNSDILSNWSHRQRHLSNFMATIFSVCWKMGINAWPSNFSSFLIEIRLRSVTSF